MYTAAWHWNGTVDCFGMSDDQRDKLFSSWWRHAEETGGELQIQAAGDDQNLLDTDRYYIHARWSSLARPFADYAWWLAQLVPDDHPEMTLEGYDRENAERTDIIIAKKQVCLCPYVMVPGETISYTPAGAEQLGESDRTGEAFQKAPPRPQPVRISAG